MDYYENEAVFMVILINITLNVYMKMTSCVRKLTNDYS